jgi:hypothetical protein
VYVTSLLVLYPLCITNHLARVSIKVHSVLLYISVQLVTKKLFSYYINSCLVRLTSVLSSTSASEMCATPHHMYALPRGPLHSHETSPCTPQTSFAKMKCKETPVIIMNDQCNSAILDYMQEFLSGIGKLKLVNTKLEADPVTAH